MSDSDQDKAEKPVKLVHYTTAEAAYSILDNGIFWMKQASQMNDTEECKKLLQELGNYVFSQPLNNTESMPHYYHSDREININGVDINENRVDISKRIKQLISLRGLPDKTYLTCFSKETCYEREENFYMGRLSMWRGYGHDIPVAIVFDESFTKEYSIKQVTYLSSNSGDLRLFIKYDLPKNPLDIDDEKSFYFLKHHGFREEKEYRRVYYNAEDISPNNGFIKDQFSFSLGHVERIIIGPCESKEIQDKTEQQLVDLLIKKKEFVDKRKDSLQKVLDNQGPPHITVASPRENEAQIMKMLQDDSKVREIIRIQCYKQSEKELYDKYIKSLQEKLKSATGENKEDLQKDISKYEEKREQLNKEGIKELVKHYVHKSDIPFRKP